MTNFHQKQTITKPEKTAMQHVFPFILQNIIFFHSFDEQSSFIPEERQLVCKYPALMFPLPVP